MTQPTHAATVRGLAKKAEPLQDMAEPDELAEVNLDFLSDPDLDIPSLNDEKLMRLCQEGDERAFTELFKRYQTQALSFIYRMIGDRTRAEALGQEAFMRIFKDAQRYQFPRRFSTWFYTIVRNLCKNELRWRSRHPSVSLEESISSHGGEDGFRLGDQIESGGPNPLDRVMQTEMVTRLKSAMDELPELDREVLILNRFQGLKYREIAEILEVPLGTVRSRIHAALEAIRKAIDEYL
jgi:RNA polymerase sigma-70 factor (ECF subfamily)